ncbi:SAM-dependent DNA methyltransferase [Nostoc sphaeroides CCNUC1]|uniref:SAM-dependent DNA methyltransferase n=1 Tax=Nostoc sphaeroides CCNUC1 TaxID=2653204 RepID=A0A5P8W058_9NOSO|nr:SAM-dependent DNA methyltransferase [Nostoc sphaeroides CCNUC1]
MHEEVEHLASKDILANLAKLEVKIQQGYGEIGGIVKIINT